MIKKLFAIIACLSLASGSEAALISRTYTYTSGNTISANENNTNENTIYNEFNGNISAANILDGTITNADVADTQFTRAKFAAAVQSTFTYVDTFGTYRRPNLKYVSATAVDVEGNTGTSNETCIQFPDSRRCVTENTSSTSVNRRFIITEAASFTGTKNSGMAPGETEGTNQYISMYAVKVQDNSTDFVIAGSTNPPTQGRYATLNTLFGTNGWLYLGTIPNGDNGGATGDIPSFTQDGGRMWLNNVNGGGSAGVNIVGIILKTGTGTSMTYNLSLGTGTAQVPTTATSYTCQFTMAATGTGLISIADANIAYIRATESANRSQFVWTFPTGGNTQNGVSQTGVVNVGRDISLFGWTDGVLGLGYNPQL